MGAQLKVLFDRPWRFLTIPADTIGRDPGVFRESVGVMGWLNMFVPNPVVLMWTIALATGLCELFGRPSRWSVLRIGWVLAVLLMTLDLIYLSQYLSFTEVGSRLVQGVQGRYLLPLLPFVLLAAPALPLSPARDVPFPWLVPATMAAFATFFWLPPAIIRFYYFG